MSQERRKLSQDRFQDGPGEGQDRAKLGQDAAKMAQDGARSLADLRIRTPKTNKNRWFFNVFATFCDLGSKMRQEVPKMRQERAKMSQERRKLSQDRFKMGQDRLKMAPSCRQDGPMTAPRRLIFATFGSQSHATINKSRWFLRLFAFLSDFGSKMCQDAPKMRQEGHKMSEERHKLSQDRKLTN